MSGFKTWLAQFAQANDAMGDLARDVRADPDWPDGPDELDVYAEHLDDLGASPAALETLQRVWELYERR